MDELRSNAKSLAYVNLFAPLALMVLSLISLGSIAPRIDGLKWHVLLMTIVQLIIFIPYFLLWFNFFRSLENGYESNETMVTAVKMGKAAMIVKILALVIGTIASITVVAGRGMFVGNVNVDMLGLCPDSGVSFTFKGLSMLSFVLIAVMYMLFSENTECKSSMKYITIALSALSIIVFVTISRNDSSYLWGVVQLGYYLLEFLFLYRIYKGFEFKS